MLRGEETVRQAEYPRNLSPPRPERQRRLAASTKWLPLAASTQVGVPSDDNRSPFPAHRPNVCGSYGLRVALQPLHLRRRSRLVVHLQDVGAGGSNPLTPTNLFKGLADPRWRFRVPTYRQSKGLSELGLLTATMLGSVPRGVDVRWPMLKRSNHLPWRTIDSKRTWA